MKFHVADSHRPLGGNRKGDTVLTIQRRWNVCCQMIELHRFDCPEVDEDRRGEGPCLPSRPPTPAELVARLRSA